VRLLQCHHYNCLLIPVTAVTGILEFHDNVALMWEKLQQLFRRQPATKLEAVQPTAEPTSVGVGLERERRDFTVLAKEFDYLFAYRPDLLPLVNEVNAGQDAASVRKLLQDSALRERDTLRELLESLKPQILQFNDAPDLQEHLGVLLATLQYTLPSKASVENFHHLYQLEVSRLPVEHPPATEGTPLAPERAALETLASEMLMLETPSTMPTPFEQSLEAQGEMLAELNVLMVRAQGSTQSEYHDFVTILANLKTAHDTHHIAPELVLRARESYRRFENLRQQQVHSLCDKQKQRIQSHLAALCALSVLPTLQHHADSTKRVLEDYLARLEYAPLEEHDLQSASALFDDFKKQLDLNYRSELMKLVSRATTVKATSLLVELQRAGQILEGGHYPNLETLAQSLSQTIAQDKHRVLSQRRAYKFDHDLHDALITFAPLAKLNNDEVESVRQSLSYLEGQREHFQTASAVVQSELQKSLTKTKAKLRRLAKQLEATRAIAQELRASNLFNNLFDDPSDTNAEDVLLEHPSRETPRGLLEAPLKHLS
jgi:hypothetical protein